MTHTPVLIVGGGPVGLTASLLLSRLGVASVLVDRRPSTSSHPRARFFDARTLEIFRQLGLAAAIEATGLPAEWTEVIRCAESVAGTQIATIESPTFHSVPRATTPATPAMTTQDGVEHILFTEARAQELADVRFSTELVHLTQNGAGCHATIRNVDSGKEEAVSAEYVIAADGARSRIREQIGRPLEGNITDTIFQDVLFHADLSPWVGERIASLLFVAHSLGTGVFQPLDGNTRWRCQMGNVDRDTEVTPAFCAEWITTAVGTTDAPAIEIESVMPWRIIAALATGFRNGRIFLAGDAAHVFTPTGGLGLNCGLAGVHNLAWKLAYVVRGLAPAGLLDTYEAEWKPIATERVRASFDNSQVLQGVFLAHFAGGDVAAAVEKAKQYCNYEGLIFGCELQSRLCLADDAPPPAVANALRDFVPSVRAGRRAPHIWLDATRSRSILDWFGTDYVIVLGHAVPDAEWTRGVGALQERSLPVRIERLPAQGADSPYGDAHVAVVRPDGVVAAEAKSAAALLPRDILSRVLPFAA